MTHRPHSSRSMKWIDSAGPAPVYRWYIVSVLRYRLSLPEFNSSGNQNALLVLLQPTIRMGAHSVIAQPSILITCTDNIKH